MSCALMMLAAVSRALVMLAALAALAWTRATPQAEELAPPPPRERVAGMRGLAVTSEVVFTAAPDRPHVLEATYAFPARARWMLTSDERAAGQRKLRYRWGEHALGVDAGRGASELYAGAAASDVILQLELHRALFVWPGGVAWEPVTGEPGTRRAPLGSHGALVATVPAGTERPSAITALRADGSELHALAEIAWGEPREGRVWPAEFDLRAGGAAVWHETVLEVDPKARFLDGFFLPPDRREPSRREAAVSGPRPVDLPRQIERRVQLEEGLDWPAALERSGEHRATLEREFGRPLDPLLAIELDAAAGPAAYLARLADPGGAIPDGWARVPTRAGRSLRVGRLAGLGTGLRELHRSLPEGARPGLAYARFDPARPERAVQLVLPLLVD